MAATTPSCSTPKTRGSRQRRGIGSEIVRLAAQHARAAGCEWLHVDFEIHLAPFYFDACGFRSTQAGLIHLRRSNDRSPLPAIWAHFTHAVMG